MDTVLAILPSILLGLGLGVVIGKLWAKLSLTRERADSATDNAVTWARDHAQLCTDVHDFVRKAKVGPGVTDRDWRDLVDQTMHEHTPQRIRWLLHSQCGTALTTVEESDVQ